MVAKILVKFNGFREHFEYFSNAPGKMHANSKMTKFTRSRVYPSKYTRAYMDMTVNKQDPAVYKQKQ